MVAQAQQAVLAEVHLLGMVEQAAQELRVKVMRVELLRATGRHTLLLAAAVLGEWVEALLAEQAPEEAVELESNHLLLEPQFIMLAAGAELAILAERRVPAGLVAGVMAALLRLMPQHHLALQTQAEVVEVQMEPVGQEAVEVLA